MKRSAMIEHLAHYYECDEFDNRHDAKINAERVLTLIERLGMFPPERFYEAKFENESVTVSSLTWEPE